MARTGDRGGARDGAGDRSGERGHHDRDPGRTPPREPGVPPRRGGDDRVAADRGAGGRPVVGRSPGVRSPGGSPPVGRPASGRLTDGRSPGARSEDRFSTATRLRVLGEQTAARVYRSQNRRQARRSRLTGRAAFLALVLCTLIVALAYPMRQYVSQQGDVADQQRTAHDAKAQVEKLRDEKARLHDDAYIEQLARERLHFVMPGEKGYTMNAPTAVAQRQQAVGPANRPWYANMMDDVDHADAAALRTGTAAGPGGGAADGKN